MALSKGQDLIYLWLPDTIFFPREKALSPVRTHISRKVVEDLASRCGPRLRILPVVRGLRY